MWDAAAFVAAYYAEHPDAPWIERVMAYKAAEAAAQAGHSGASPRPPRTDATPDAEGVETWVKAAIDDELDEVESDVEGTRNDRLNSRALRCFRLALLAGYNLDNIADALFAAARVAGATANPHTDTEIRNTLRSARRKALEDGPANPPDDHVHVVGVEAFEVDEDETDMTDDGRPETDAGDASAGFGFVGFGFVGGFVGGFAIVEIVVVLPYDPNRDFDADDDDDGKGKTYTRGDGSRRNAKAEAALLAIIRLLAESARNGEDGGGGSGGSWAPASSPTPTTTRPGSRTQSSCAPRSCGSSSRPADASRTRCGRPSRCRRCGR